ncbi:S41 family peptidase [Flavobacterium sp. LAR06]|uniref:S41 family peptidase n=1 Tax=Flavobacterium sp. LAR06 TaxID=3064897 RepID=UPI0035C0F1C7
MNLKKLALTLLIVISYNTYAQKCSCEDNFNWLKKNFEENDAGFQYVIDQKGLIEYQNHSALFAKKVKKINDLKECRTILLDWLHFFRPAHLSLEINQDYVNKTASQTKTEPAKNWEKLQITEEELKSRTSKNTQPTFEGIWSSPPYTIGVAKVNDEFIGYVLDVKGTKWSQYQVKFKMKQNLDKTYSAVYFMGDFSSQKFSNVQLIGSNFLKIGFISLKRVFPNNFKEDSDISNYLESLTAQRPFIKEISNKSVLLRIPSFNYSNKKVVDSILLANNKLILSKENLIIDLRNNGGGSDATFQKIIPYLYTNPIRTVGVEFLSTVQNNKRMQGFMADSDWSAEEKDWAKKGLEKLNANMGKFVNLNEKAVDEHRLDSIYVYPKNVAIIINENNGSTTEQFLLTAKQSKKVKLFGTTTEGVLDISNMHFIDFPCKDLKLGYSLSKSLRIPGMQIDGKGIQPDYYIDKSIPDQEWLKFTENILNVN